MPVLKRILAAVRSVVSARPLLATRVDQASQKGAGSPGQYGSEATLEVDPDHIAGVRLSYAPSPDGDPDPGEIVWTWTPYEERDGRGKDRPMLIVAAEANGSFLAAQLTSKSHLGESDFVPIGTGTWDREGRASWVNLDRIFRVYSSGMRREATSLDAQRFRMVARALHARYGWK